MHAYMQLAKRKLARFPAHFHRTVDLGCMWLHAWIHIKLGFLEMTESCAYNIISSWNQMFAAGGFFYTL